MDNKTLTGLSRKQYTIPAYTTKTIDYNDTKPNYFRVQNTGDSPIYCGTSHIPTAKNYDFMCNAKSMKMYAEPFHRTTIYIFNPSASDIIVTVLSFSAEFDPIALTLSDITIDLPTSDLGISSVISSFETPLPKGSNLIGKVEVANHPDYMTTLLSMNETVNSINGRLLRVGECAESLGIIENSQTVYTPDLEELKQKLYEVKVATENINSYMTALTNCADSLIVLNKASRKYCVCFTFALPEEEVVSPPADHKITNINFFSNDTESMVQLKISQNDSPSATFTTIEVNPGEVLNDVRCYADSISVSEDGAGCRIVVEVSEV